MADKKKYYYLLDRVTLEDLLFFYPVTKVFSSFWKIVIYMLGNKEEILLTHNDLVYLRQEVKKSDEKMLKLLDEQLEKRKLRTEGKSGEAKTQQKGQINLFREDISKEKNELVKRYKDDIAQISQGSANSSVDNFLNTVALIIKNRDDEREDFKLFTSPLLDRNSKELAKASFPSSKQEDDWKISDDLPSFPKLRQKVLKDCNITSVSILNEVQKSFNLLGDVEVKHVRK